VVRLSFLNSNVALHFTMLDHNAETIVVNGSKSFVTMPVCHRGGEGPSDVSSPRLFVRSRTEPLRPCAPLRSPAKTL
jgi:hypothetical protein